MRSSRKIRYAIVGLGHLSQFAILPAFGHCKHAEMGLLVTGDAKKAQPLSRKYGVPAYGYEDYEDALEKEKIDAAFIVLPNTLHREFTERSAKVGVHVLCEKPMAASAGDCKAMIRACERAKVQLMIAYRLHFTEPHLKAVEAARSGKLGDVRLFSAVFAMQVDDGNIRTKRKMGGGPLLDIGVYCINAARYLFGRNPTEVTALAASSNDPRFQEIDEMVGAVLRFPDDRLASFICSFGAQDISQFNLVGTKGILFGEPAFDYSLPLQWSIKRDGHTKVNHFSKGDQFGSEMDYFAQCIQKGRKPEPSGVEGLTDVEIVEAIAQSHKKGRAIKIKLPKKTQWPDEPQIIKRPAIRSEPRLVKAKAPHR
jgi:predicted dehydrogenase